MSPDAGTWYPVTQYGKHTIELDRYWVSSIGAQVYDAKREKLLRARYRHSVARRANVAGQNHLTVWLRTGTGKQVSAQPHRVLYYAAHPNTLPHHVIRHCDDNPENNNLDNLIHGTVTENNADKIGKLYVRRSAKLTADIARDIYSAQDTLLAIATRFNTTRPMVQHIKAGRRWSHATAHLRFIHAAAPTIDILTMEHIFVES